MVRIVSGLVMLTLLVGCEQENQPLPFDPGAVGSQTISAQGGSVSTPAGAAVHFPSGALSGSVTVTIGETEVPAQAQSAGTAASSAFAIEPAGTVLSQAADLELKFSKNIDPSRSWLASIVSVTNGLVEEHASSRVDLSTGIVGTEIDRLGTVLVVIPSASNVFPVRASVSAALIPVSSPAVFLGVTADSISVTCGDPDDPCAGSTVTASQNLLDMVEDAALIYPKIEGVFRIGATQVTGSITANTSLRILLESGLTAETVEVNAVLEPTAATTVTESASEIRFSQVHHRISGSGEQSGSVNETTTLVVPRTGSTGSVTIHRTFDIETSGGAREPATVTITFPVTIHG